MAEQGLRRIIDIGRRFFGWVTRTAPRTALAVAIGALLCTGLLAIEVMSQQKTVWCSKGDVLSIRTSLGSSSRRCDDFFTLRDWRVLPVTIQVVRRTENATCQRLAAGWECTNPVPPRAAAAPPCLNTDLRKWEGRWVQDEPYTMQIAKFVAQERRSVYELLCRHDPDNGDILDGYAVGVLEVMTRSGDVGLRYTMRYRAMIAFDANGVPQVHDTSRQERLLVDQVSSGAEGSDDELAEFRLLIQKLRERETTGESGVKCFREHASETKLVFRCQYNDRNGPLMGLSFAKTLTRN